jgi:hypothetical protein
MSDSKGEPVQQMADAGGEGNTMWDQKKSTGKKF